MLFIDTVITASLDYSMTRVGTKFEQWEGIAQVTVGGC